MCYMTVNTNGYNVTNFENSISCVHCLHKHTYWSEAFLVGTHAYCDRGVGTAGATGARAPAMLKPRGREYLIAPAIFSHIFACCSLNFHSLSLCCLHTITRSSAIAEGPRDASCQLKSCQLPRNTAETTCTTSPEQIEIMKLEGYGGPMCNKHYCKKT